MVIGGGVFFGIVVGGDFLFPQQEWAYTLPRGSVISRILTTHWDWMGMFQARKEREFLQKVPGGPFPQVFKP